MSIQIIAIGLVIVSLLLAGLAIKSLIKKNWFFQWLRGTSGFAILFTALLAGVFALDLFGYSHSSDGNVIATLRFDALGHQAFNVELTDDKGTRETYKLDGDQWQLDARLLTWVGPLAAAGQKPLYRLDRLSGRYVSLEQARNGEQSVFALEQSQFVDLWQIFNRFNAWIDVSYGSAVYMPMENGAVFSVYLTAKGMNVRPINSIAKKVLKDWE